MSGELKLNDRVVLQAADVAARIGVEPDTFSSWRSRGWPRANPVPDPDAWINARTPVWYPETIDAWDRRRPSRSG